MERTLLYFKMNKALRFTKVISFFQIAVMKILIQTFFGKNVLKKVDVTRCACLELVSNQPFAENLNILLMIAC